MSKVNTMPRIESSRQWTWCAHVVTGAFAAAMAAVTAGAGVATAQPVSDADATPRVVGRNGSGDERSEHAQSDQGQQPAAAAQPATPSDATLANRPAVTERVTFREAVERALARNPSIEQAAADILRADALVRQARAAALPNVNFNITTTTVHPVIDFDGQSATPRNQLTATPNASAMLYAPVLWAQRAQAQDNKVVAERSRDETRRQTASPRRRRIWRSSASGVSRKPRCARATRRGRTTISRFSRRRRAPAAS